MHVDADLCVQKHFNIIIIIIIIIIVKCVLVVSS